MSTTDTKEQKSNCCNTEVKVSESDEGTCFYYCSKCKKPCDIAVSNIDIKEQLMREFRESDMCFDDYGETGKRILHTNRDVTPEVEAFLDHALTTMQEAVERETVERLEKLKQEVINDVPENNDYEAAKTLWNGLEDVINSLKK